jgi:hypothetical protein
MLRTDYIFSNWIFVWYILYELSIINYNPKIWLIISLIILIHYIILLIYYKRFYMLFIYVIVNIIIKVLPILSLYNTKIVLKDFIFGIFLFIIYNFWLLYNNYNAIKVAKSFYNALTYNKINSPLMTFINKLININK